MKTLKRLGVIMMSVTACAWISGCSGSEPQTNTPNAAADGSAQTPSANSGSAQTPSETPGGAGNKTGAASEASGDKTGTAGDTANAGSEKGKTLVAFYSASGRTKRVAGIIADATQGTLFELVPSPAYTDADLNYNNSNSRVSREHDDPALRNIALAQTTPDNWDDYKTVYIGYPIWWAIAAWPVDNFVKQNDFSGKRVIPFATSYSSGFGQSGELLKAMSSSGTWIDGKRFRENPSESDVVDWVKSIGQ